MSEEKEKLSIYVDSETARAIRMESARLGIAQGDLIAQALSEYVDRGHAEDRGREAQSDSEDQDQGARAQILPVKLINPEELKRRKKDQTERETRELRIAKAREILDDWQAFDIDMIELYERRMRELGEKKLAKELRELADYKRRVI